METLTTKHMSIIDLKKDTKALKQLKQLSRKSTGEQLKVFDEDSIIICKHNKNIIGMCCIAMKSPESHFENEAEIEIPYLYNYVCDISQKKKKPSVAIMNFAKDFIDVQKIGKEINLDVLNDNHHAMQFFEKNNFVKCGEYQQSVKEYIKYTYVFPDTTLTPHD